jgi:hypothetical protein
MGTPATPIVASDRYFARGKTKIYVCPTVTVLTAPTRAEMTAGTDLSPEVAAISGWLITSAQTDTPDLGTIFTSTIPGATSMASDNTVDMYADDNGVDVRGVLARGSTWVVLILYGGDVTGAKMDCFRTRIRSVGKPVAVDDSAGLVQVSFSVTATPAENIAVPA